MSMEQASIAQHCKSLRLASIGGQFASLAEEAGKHAAGGFAGKCACELVEAVVLHGFS